MKKVLVKRSRSVPKFQNPPPQPAKKQKSAAEVTTTILSELRQLPPSEQNKIIEEVLKEIGIDRHRAYHIALGEQDRAAKDAEMFFQNKGGLEKVVTASIENNDQAGR